MQITRTTKAFALASMFGFAALTTPVFAADGDAMQSFPRDFAAMANKDGMVSKKDFLAMMEKKFDTMDKANKGMLSTTDVMRIFSDRTGN